MSTTFFYPPPIFRKTLKLNKSFTIKELCEKLNIPCLASGGWTERKVGIKHSDELCIEAEPGDWGAVRVTLRKTTAKKEIQTALMILAYAMHDTVAKESIKNLPWSKISLPPGRLRTGKALSNKERQRLFRKRQSKLS